MLQMRYHGIDIAKELQTERKRFAKDYKKNTENQYLIDALA